ncbi:chromosome condensation complex Condensin, subunit G [Massospora cicadina]|nr:chromosome condensation complex Condensin, subunit G [Massospora cicadina]
MERRKAKPAEATVNLWKRVGEIFQDAQRTGQAFRRCRVALRKVQEDCVNGEFDKVIIRAINCTLTHRRREPEIDRVINFVATFLNYASEADRKSQIKLARQDAEQEAKQKGKDANRDADDGTSAALDNAPPTPTAMLAEKIVIFYMQGLKAADKVVRARVCQILAAAIIFLGPIEVELHRSLRRGLAERLLDREPNIRALAAQALAPLQGDDSIGHPDKLVDKLIEALQLDPSHEVRRNILRGIAQNPRTLPSILARCRDVDPHIRKEVFQRNMMTILQREQLLRWGLTDREPAVSQACLDMVSGVWLPQIEGNLIELLEKLDVMNNDVAELALKAYLKAHADFWRGFRFPENFWAHLGIESVFLARVLIAFVQAEEDFDKLDELLPSASTMALLIKEQCNVTTSCADEDLRIDNDFILVQLLEITRLHDFADEAGRRKVYDVLRKMFVQVEANDEQIRLMVLIVRKLSNDELDFTRTMVEIQSDILEDVNTDFHGVSFKDIEEDLEVEEKREEHRDFLNAAYKCLLTSKHMLRLCELTIDKNVLISGILNDLIYPASKCNIDVLQDVGTECLGLCCMLDKTLAANNFQHFMHTCKDEEPDTRLASLKIALDLCAIYGVAPSPFTTSTAKLYDFFKSILRSDDMEFLAVAAQGIAKLYLAGVMDDFEMLGRLIQLYFIPATADNLKLRQGLHYFLEVYAYFSPNNQAVIAKAFVPSLLRLSAVYKKFGVKYPMVTPLQIGQQLADWTNPHKSSADPAYNLHSAIAIELLKAAFQPDEANRKLIFQVLARLAVDTFTQPAKLVCVTRLIEGFKERCHFPDAVTRNIATKFGANIAKQLGAHPPKLLPRAPIQLTTRPASTPRCWRLRGGCSARLKVTLYASADANWSDSEAKRPSAEPSAAPKRRKVKQEVDSDEDASYAP